MRNALVTLAAITCAVACNKPPPPPARVKVAFTLAFAAPRPNTAAVKIPDGQTVYAESEAVLTEDNIKRARVMTSDGQAQIFVTFNAAGARILERVSTANVGNYLVVSLDQSPTLALRLAGPIPDGMAALYGLPQNQADLEALADRIGPPVRR